MQRPEDPTQPPTEPELAGRVEFVLGGGGVLGAHEVGMLWALCEAGIQPDAVVGTSVGAVNGALVAAGFGPDAVTHLANLWTSVGEDGVFGGSVLTRMGTLVRSRTHLHSSDRLRELLEAHLPVTRIEELAVPFQCVAASIERACAHWFTSGPIVDAVLASAAVPGLLAPVEIDGEHYVDGGLVHSIPVGRALSLGADTVYVLQVGRVEEPLSPPTTPLQVALVAFEIARRHRFVEEMRHLPRDVTVHVLPAGEGAPRCRCGCSPRRSCRHGCPVGCVVPHDDPRPLVVLSRHAGPGDSLLLVHELLSQYGRRPRIVLKAALQWDPLLDLLLNRLPNRFVSAARESGAAAIGELARDLGAADAVVIFPEGANFTADRRTRGIARLEQAGRHEHAARARGLRHLLAPRPGGTLAAIDAAPHADVVFVAHSGLEDLSTLRDLWRGLPMDAVVRARLWTVAGEDVPDEPAARVDWLYAWWERLDAWIDSARAARAGGTRA